MSSSTTGLGLALACAISGILAGCTFLPAAGPDAKAIEASAVVKVAAQGGRSGIDYVLVDINQEIVMIAGGSGATSLRGTFGGGRGPAPELPLGVGDVVQVAIFESRAGGLFIPDDAGSRPGNFVTLPQQTIDKSGAINVPYAGRVAAAGKSIPQVQTEIENLLINKAIEPQVVISLVEARSGQVSVLGDVNDPQKLQINPAGERILDVIARAGGVSTPGIETYVTLQRRGHEGTILFDALVNTPQENIYVLPGDLIFVSRERRTYLVFGASGLNGRINFDDADLTLAEAVAQAGGFLDARSEPSQVFLYRIVERSLVERMGVAVGAGTSAEIPVIFRATFRDPAGFFAAQAFAMRDKDVIYTSNSHANETLKFLSFVTAVTGAPAQIGTDAVVTRNAVRELGR